MTYPPRFGITSGNYIPGFTAGARLFVCEKRVASFSGKLFSNYKKRCFPLFTINREQALIAADKIRTGKVL